MNQKLRHTITLCSLVFGFVLSSCSNLDHQHTFSNTWSYDERFHWNASTCGHDVIANKEPHMIAESGNLSDPIIVMIYDCYICDYFDIDYYGTITWLNYDGSILRKSEHLYGLMPSYNGDIPIREAYAQASFTFRGWSPEIAPVDGNTAYTARYNVSDDVLIYTLDNDSYSISGVNTKISEYDTILIPSYYDGIKVTSISSNVFSSYTNLINVVIDYDSQLTSIGESAFNGCSSLSSIYLPSTVTTLGYEAFKGCSNLTIYCELESQPSSWDNDYNPDNCPIIWDVTYEEYLQIITD